MLMSQEEILLAAARGEMGYLPYLTLDDIEDIVRRFTGASREEILVLKEVWCNCRALCVRQVPRERCAGQETPGLPPAGVYDDPSRPPTPPKEDPCVDKLYKAVCVDVGVSTLYAAKTAMEVTLPLLKDSTAAGIVRGLIALCEVLIRSCNAKKLSAEALVGLCTAAVAADALKQKVDARSMIVSTTIDKILPESVKAAALDCCKNKPAGPLAAAPIPAWVADLIV